MITEWKKQRRQDHLWPCLPKGLYNLQESFGRKGIGGRTFMICFGEDFPLFKGKNLGFIAMLLSQYPNLRQFSIIFKYL